MLTRRATQRHSRRRRSRRRNRPPRRSRHSRSGPSRRSRRCGRSGHRSGPSRRDRRCRYGRRDHRSGPPCGGRHRPSCGGVSVFELRGRHVTVTRNAATGGQPDVTTRTATRRVSPPPVHRLITDRTDTAITRRAHIDGDDPRAVTAHRRATPARHRRRAAKTPAPDSAPITRTHTPQIRQIINAHPLRRPLGSRVHRHRASASRTSAHPVTDPRSGHDHRSVNPFTANRTATRIPGRATHISRSEIHRRHQTPKPRKPRRRKTIQTINRYQHRQHKQHRPTATRPTRSVHNPTLHTEHLPCRESEKCERIAMQHQRFGSVAAVSQHHYSGRRNSLSLAAV